jgi:hypothetical protein
MGKAFSRALALTCQKLLINKCAPFQTLGTVFMRTVAIKLTGGGLNRMKRLCIRCGALILAAVFVPQDCFPRSSAAQNIAMDDPPVDRVFIQVCLPDRVTYFDQISVDVTDMPEDVDLTTVRQLFETAKISTPMDRPQDADGARVYETVRLWRTPKSPSEFSKPFIHAGTTTIGSDGGLFAYLLGSTKRNQPVFSYYTYQRAKDIVGLHLKLAINRDGSDQERQFWYKVPPGLQKGVYTSWAVPVSEENGRFDTASVMLTLTHGGAMPLYPVGEHAPRVRFTLFTGKEDGLDTKAVLRGRYAAQLERAKARQPYAPSENVLFIAGSQSEIPACDE